MALNLADQMAEIRHGPWVSRAITTLTLTIPWEYLAQDNHRHLPRHGRLITAPGYRRAKLAVEQIAALSWRGPQLVGPVQVYGRAWFPDKRKRDAGNYRKLLTDAFSGIAYADDSQVWRETWDRCGVDRANPRIELTVEPLTTPNEEAGP